ncbi:MAG: prepilin-type N-terminal cleavage/methylation domain-containing protein [Verrucomicrobia bacterium]|nr:MAG: prepilin-type N-terminal cleavage/methylation domain-containing protein [Verrucomicrobiota bacterium]
MKTHHTPVKLTMHSIPSADRLTPRRCGFSLVELLTVIAIISVLMTVATVGIGSLLSGKGVSTAVSTTEAVFAEARTLAMGRLTNAAVLVSIQDSTNMDTYLRRLVVAYKEIDPLTNKQSGEWTLASRGVTLPEKVYFSQTLSCKDHQKGGSGIAKVTLGGSKVKRDYQGQYLIYEFNAEGICTTPGASFVVGTGTRAIGGTEARPRRMNSAKRDFGGFVVWRNGSTSLFHDPLQILKNGDNITFF